jgi:hypothetical protein
MEESILKIVKAKDDWKCTVEIKDNAKGEPAITVKTRSDETAKSAGTEALDEYNRLKEEINKTPEAPKTTE